MDDQWYVETSDPEELEVVHGIQDAPFVWFTRPIVLAGDSSPALPRKRRKLVHKPSNANDSYEVDGRRKWTISQDVHDGSITLVRSSSELPTSTVVSDDERQDLTSCIPLAKDPDLVNRGDVNFELFSQVPLDDKTSMDIGLAMLAGGSQDELDIISRPLFSEDAKFERQIFTSDAHGFSVQQAPSYSEEHPSHEGRGSTEQEVTGYLPGSPGSFSLFTPYEENVPGDKYEDRELSLRSASPHDSETQVVNQTRFSSLLPSSPPHTSTSIIKTPHHSQSDSPERASSIQPQSNAGHIVGPTQAPSGDEEVAPQFLDGVDGIAPGRYDLRARQIRQLKPYEYDKQLYKQQMRRMPDAIVKIVSPQRHGSSRTHKHRDRHEDDDFIVTSEEGKESQVARKRATEDRRTSEALAERTEVPSNSFSWLPDAFHMSDDDDDLAPISPLVEKGYPSRSGSEDLVERGKDHLKRLQRFPLKEARIRYVDGTDRDNKERAGDVRNVTHSAITYRRRKDIQQSDQDQTESAFRKSTDGLHGHTASSVSDIFRRDTSEGPPLTFRMDGFDMNNDFSDEEWPPGRSYTGATVSKDNGASDERDEDASHFRHKRSDKDGITSSRSASGSGADDEMQNELFTRLSRKQRRALAHMLPKVMLTRLAEQSSASRQPGHLRSESMTDRAEVDSGSDDASLIPGRSRVTKRAGSANVIYRIKGDSESSGSESEAGIIEKPVASVINVESSSDSDASSAGISNDENDDVLEESIADAGYFDQDFSRQPFRRREGPLFDMMLCRTRRRKGGTGNSKRRLSGEASRTGGHSLKANGIDVSIPRSPGQPRLRHVHSRGKQTRIFVASPTSPGERRHDDSIDLTGLELPFRSSEDMADEVAEVAHSELQKRLTKKQKRAALQKAALHTIAGKGKKIGSGRRKGFMTVQIDIADDGLRNAIKPLYSDGLRQTPPSSSDIQSSKFEQPPQRASQHRKEIGTGKAAFKQTSLHDFGYNDTFSSNTLQYVATPKRSSSIRPTAERNDENRVRICKLDMGVSIPTPGLAFGGATYLGKQLLSDLLDFAFKVESLPRPSPYEGFGLISLDVEMPCTRFVEAIEVTCNTVTGWLDDESPQSTDEDNMRRYERLMQSICHFTGWMYAKSDEDGRKSVQIAVLTCASRITETLQEKFMAAQSRTWCLDFRCLSIMWFNVELTTRLLAVARRHRFDMDLSCWRGAVILLAKTLIGYGITNALQPIADHDVTSSTVSLRAAELWICLIHLLSQANCFDHPPLDNNSVFWSIVLQAIKEGEKLTASSIEISEHLWKLIFGLCALSYFSAHGIATSEPHLPQCWDIVGLALDTIRLIHDKGQDTIVPRESLKRRDRYVRMVVARCFILGRKWNWPLRDANALFRKLVNIFRSRNFGNLLGEDSTFPAFMRYHKVDYLNELRDSDTAFGLYLKLAMRAAKAEPDGDARTKARMTKLLSLVVPLSDVTFTKMNPPTTAELSMLVNRFSAIVIAILVEGKDTNLQSRIGQARRFVNFASADDRSRDTCIFAAMYIFIAVNHLSLELEEPLSWLGEMSELLLAEFQRNLRETQKEANARGADGVQRLRRVVLRLHRVLECVTDIIENPNMTTESTTPRYPNVGLLSGPWVKRCFTLKDLTNIISTRFLILRLVQSFLKAREKVIPPRRRPVPIINSNDNSESQDLLGEFALDDEVLALIPLDDGSDDIWKKDKEVAEIVDDVIIPTVYRLLLQCVNDPTARSSDENNVDDWVDCWVGCAAIVVRNEKKTWDYYLRMGDASSSIIDDFFCRRRVAVRFMDQLLKQDPTVYEKDYEKYFLKEFLKCLVGFRITLEHEYLSTLFSVDGLRHPLLRGIAVNGTPEQGFRVSRADVLQARDEIIAHIFSNFDSILSSSGSELDKNVLAECMLAMLVTMQMTFEVLQKQASPEDCDRYGELCRYVFSNIRKYEQIHSLSRLASSIAWGDSTFGDLPVA